MLPEAAIPDPNWLLSSAAQSAAAIVAIIGGFIISRLLALSAEISSLENRKHDLETELVFKEQLAR